MSDDFSVRVGLPLDSDGFLRRECPSCEQEFKWLTSDEDDDGDVSPDQFFCPLCGAAADADQWWTPAQIEYMQGMAAPEIDRAVQSTMEDAFKGVKGITFKPDRNFSLGIPTPDPLTEPDGDMVRVEPPCHPEEPIKVTSEATGRLHCLVCGSEFAA